jgi:hypothetical protein
MKPDWQSDDGRVRLYRGDCLEVLPHIEPVVLVLTDPPFGIGNFVQTSGRIKGRGKNIGKAVPWNKSGMADGVLPMLRRMSKHRIIWGANYFNCFEDKFGAIVWDKCQPMPNFSKVEVASCTHFKKTEVVRIPWTNSEAGRLAATDHPCERPVDLYEWCLDYIPGARDGLVLDPYMGSASSAVACVRKGRPYIGVEISEEYFDIAVKRIKDAIVESKGGPLFAEKPDPQETMFDA